MLEPVHFSPQPRSGGKRADSRAREAGRPEIDKFETALRRDGRPGGFFIGWDFSKDVEKEIERIKKIDDPLWIIPVRAQQLIEESFNVELMVLRGM